MRSTVGWLDVVCTNQGWGDQLVQLWRMTTQRDRGAPSEVTVEMLKGQGICTAAIEVSDARIAASRVAMNSESFVEWMRRK